CGRVDSQPCALSMVLRRPCPSNDLPRECRALPLKSARSPALAQRSAGAAREIKRLIGTSVERVEQGSELVDHAGATMHEVVTAIQRVTEIMGEISSASAEQSAGVRQVGAAVSKMDE